ncbi:MAG: hypothetical protein PF541_03035 [Prolixibacteraceae bacterium]|jgi:hypothetical protein|nr:hypothetical protein [Prolixibacteraceae bacterium]
MKTNIFIIGLLLGLFFNVSCSKEEITKPGLVIVKLQNVEDFDKVFIGMYEDNEIWRTPSFGWLDERSGIIDSDSILLTRKILSNEFVLVAEGLVYGRDAMLDLTVKEYIKMQNELGELSIPEDVILEHVVDKEPYIEFYYDENRPRIFELNDVDEINDIIENGELDQYFKKVK